MRLTWACEYCGTDSHEVMLPKGWDNDCGSVACEECVQRITGERMIIEECWEKYMDLHDDLLSDEDWVAHERHVGYEANVTTYEDRKRAEEYGEEEVQGEVGCH